MFARVGLSAPSPALVLRTLAGGSASIPLAKKQLKFIIMYLHKLTISNFKSYKDVSFEFHPKINVFTGVNNAGKTTALEAISLWFECYQNLIQQAGKRVGEQYKKGDYILGTSSPTYISYNNITSVRSPNYNDIFTNLEADPKKPIVITATFKSAAQPEEALEIPLYLSRADGDNYKIGCMDFSNFNFNLFNDKNFLNDPKDGIHITYASPVSTILAVEESQLQAKINYLKRSRASIQVFRNRLKQLKNRNNGDFDRFLNELTGILTDNKAKISFTFGTDANNIHEIVYIQIDKETPKDISLLGSGTLQIIEILLSLFEENRDLHLILLDEPDSHIHHALQKRLLRTLENFTSKEQVFLTTHNEALIRAAKPQWVFHLEKTNINHYKPIASQDFLANTVKKGFQPSILSPIILNLTETNTLDFIQALEADKLILVEGADDAKRIQQILYLNTNSGKRYAFWANDGADAYFIQLGGLKSIFKAIKNKTSLWAKSVLVMDKDDMTDQHIQKITDAFKNKLELPTHIWSAYNFESVLLSDLHKLGALLFNYIQREKPDTILTISDIQNRLAQGINNVIPKLAQLYSSEEELNRIFGKISTRRTALAALNLTNIFEADKDIKRTLEAYYKSCLMPERIYKIARKSHLEEILKFVIGDEFSFNLQQNFNDLFALVNNSVAINDEYRQILGI
jgi:AAA15 family ATPase/GTPase